VTTYTEVDQLFEQVLDTRAVVSLFQPLVHLATGEVIGFEALARGPEGPLHSPTALFDAAARADRVGELDWVCRASGLRAAAAANLDPNITWFVNVEPAGLSYPCPEDLVDVVRDTERSLRVVTELTERGIDTDPARLLSAAATARRLSRGVALDDVGGVPRSLSLLPFVQPDVVKLDLSLLHDGDRQRAATIANAVRAYAEQTGAVVLAEGIETDDHLRLAKVLGATYGQGWLFGRPMPLPERVSAPRHPLPFSQRVHDDVTATPFEIVTAHRDSDRATKEHLLPMSLHLEQQALSGDESLVLLSTFQDAQFFTPLTARRYAELASRNVFTAALAAGSPAIDVPGVRWVTLPPGDSLIQQWNVIVVGAHFAGALIARDCEDTGPDRSRRFDYVVTHDRALVLRAARAMFRYVTAAADASDVESA
jgi:EAL domain-containing protein (putative c-di-GMP-specific phosphodiesterase class I)